MLITVAVGIVALLAGSGLTLWLVAGNAATLTADELRAVTDEAVEALEGESHEGQSPGIVVDALEEELESAAFRQGHPAAEAGIADHDTIDDGPDGTRMVYFVAVHPVDEMEPELCVSVTEREDSSPGDHYFDAEYVGASKCEH